MTATAGLREVGAAEWDPLLDALGLTDAYYGRAYLDASAPLAGGTPTLLHLEAPGGHVVFACVVRSDPPDVVSPYGYGGPVPVGDDPPLAAFRDAYAGWCRARGVVSTFVVHHPLLGTARAAATLGWHEVPLAGTVAWPLTADDPGETLHRHHRRLVRRAEAAGLRARVQPAPADLAPFVGLYEDTMRRAGATPFYFFDAAYWEALRRVEPVEVDVHDADGQLVAAVLGMGRPPWLHYHLGGASEAGRRSGASQLAQLTLARYGRAHGYAALHLGGGVGGRDDSLLAYKRRFAPDGLLPAAVGKAVHDRERYLALSGAAEVDWQGFFPAYRRPR
jgi:hypothetical protein